MAITKMVTPIESEEIVGACPGPSSNSTDGRLIPSTDELFEWSEYTQVSIK